MRTRVFFVCSAVVLGSIVTSSAPAVNTNHRDHAHKPRRSNSRIPRPSLINDITPSTWEDCLRQFLDYLCAVVRCDAASLDIQSQVTAFIANYKAHGIDPNLTQGQRDDGFDATIAAMEQAAADPGVLPDALRNELLETLNDIANDLEE